MRRNVTSTKNILPIKDSPSFGPRKSPRNMKRPIIFGSTKLTVSIVVFGLFLVSNYLLLNSSVPDSRINTIIDNSSNDISDQEQQEQEIPKSLSLTPLRDVDLELFTVRINTFKRHEQLLVSVRHLSTCQGVAQIQVVWCEEEEPPPELLEFPKVVVERHEVNSLNERFHVLEETPTLGILSIDDDVLRPCEAIDAGTP